MVKVNPKRTLKSLFSREEVEILNQLDSEHRVKIIEERIKSHKKREKAQSNNQLMREFIHSDTDLVRDFEIFKAMAKLRDSASCFES